MSDDRHSEWLWGHTTASITFNDPIWAAPSRHFVDALCERQQRLGQPAGAG